MLSKRHYADKAGWDKSEGMCQMKELGKMLLICMLMSSLLMIIKSSTYYLVFVNFRVMVNYHKGKSAA